MTQFQNPSTRLAVHSNMPSNTQIAVTGLAVVATGLVGYAAWFDYKRRNDAVFRKNLSKCIPG